MDDATSAIAISEAFAAAGVTAHLREAWAETAPDDDAERAAAWIDCSGRNAIELFGSLAAALKGGARVNVGLYGNTTEASKSEGGGALVPLPMSDGGTVRGTVKLYWSWNGLAPNRLLNVQFSADGGVTWTNIATGVYADVGSSGLEWATTNFPSTGMGVWRVMTTNEPPPNCSPC